MSKINMSIYANTLNDIASMKRAFRNSFQKEFMSLSVDNNEVANDFVSVNYHLKTTSNNVDMNDKVTVKSRLLNDDTFTLAINSKDEDGKVVHFTLFFNEDIRKEIVNALENTIVNKKEE
jgi:hypothetical protein